MKKLTLILVSALVAVAAAGQERAWEYWRNPEGYIRNQADVVLGQVDRTLQEHPATTTPSAERQLALAALDAIVHDTANDDSPELHAFMDTRIGRVLEQLQGKAPRKGLEIFKLYNDGFIVRSRSITIGFDLCGTRGQVKWIPDKVMQELVGLCDVLFISHRDPDHADANVVQMATDRGIPVYAPEDYDNPAVKHVRSDFTAGKLQVQLLPGHQDNLQNNIYVVTFPEGKTVAHCGDQYNREDLPWLKTVSSQLTRTLDVLIIDCWALELKETIQGFAPRTVIFGHENEMGHTIDHREAFWLTQYKQDIMALPVPGVILCWGEGYRSR